MRSLNGTAKLAAALDRLLAKAGERHGDRLVMLCSFQKEESVLLDAVSRVAAATRVVTIDTGVLFPETLATWRAFEERFGVAMDVEDETDSRRGIVKYNPLARWTDEDVWQVIQAKELPYNGLHDQGYDSIGCATCTAPGAGRAGRWAGTDKLECGLHVV